MKRMEIGFGPEGEETKPFQLFLTFESLETASEAIKAIDVQFEQAKRGNTQSPFVTLQTTTGVALVRVSNIRYIDVIDWS